MTIPLPSGIAVERQRATAASGRSEVHGPSKATATHSEAVEAKIREAARDFEAVFLRQMLSALERTTKVGSRGPNMAGQQTYGSMVVEAVADAVARAGGLGLAKVMSNALIGRGAASSSDGTSGGISKFDGGVRAGGSGTQASNARPTKPAVQENSSQGLSSNAVPRTEIRTTNPLIAGQLADRRFR